MAINFLTSGTGSMNVLKIPEGGNIFPLWAPWDGLH